ncbi:MAG: DNA repair protein RecO [Gammaproteobacteria bacterium]|nr:DNA repair protein RecO [Gammaproteobacteria bacterium]
MSQPRRVKLEPAFILHMRPFRDSSQILDIFSREHGKLALVARGSRGAKSRLRGLLRPFMPLTLSWVQRTDLGTLTGAEMRASPLTLGGDVLLSGYYVNELLLHLLHRHDPQPALFDAYGQTIERLVGSATPARQLREFEIELLRQIGYAINLDHEAGASTPLSGDHYYEYRVEQGPVAVSKRDGDMVFKGSVLSAISDRQFDDSATLKAANRLLREVLAFHLGGKELKSRRVLVDLHRARIAAPKGKAS